MDRPLDPAVASSRRLAGTSVVADAKTANTLPVLCPLFPIERIFSLSLISHIPLSYTTATTGKAL